MPSNSQHKGHFAEQIAEHFLQRQGLRPVGRNIFFKTGELDLVMQHRETLVFVEVRFRKQSEFGSAAETVTRTKQKKLIQTALLYCQKHGITSPWRIDVVAITQYNQQTNINWIPSAVTD